MILVLAAWCAGLAAGGFLLAPAVVSKVLLAAFAAGAVVALSVALLQPGRRATSLLLAPLLLLLGVAAGAASVHVPGPATADNYYGRHVTIVGVALRSSSGATYQSFWLAQLRYSGRPLRGTVQVTSRSPVPVVPGSTVRATGTLERLPGRAYDGSLGYDDRMERQGVLAAMPAASFQAIAPPGPLSVTASAWRLRIAISSGIRARVPEPEATILLGELVGIRGKLPAPVEADLVDSGLVHVLALSGLKVAVVAGILAAMLRRSGRRAAVLAIFGVFAYVLVGGASSAALRSAVMGSLALFAQVLRRDVDPLRSLLLAASVMLGFNPQLASDLSFQYSFLGVLGIQLLQESIDRRLGVLPHPFREALSVSLAAQLTTLPLTAAYFHVLPAAGPLANTLVVPFIGPTMAAAAWVASGWPGAGGLVLLLAGGSAHALLLLAHLAAAAPGGVVRVPWFGSAHAVIYYCAGGLLLAAARWRRFSPAILLSMLPSLALCGLLTSLPDGRLHLVFLDTPGGGALVTAPDGARMLLDAGSSPVKLGAALDSLLPPPAPAVDALLLTGSGPGAAGGIGGLGPRTPGLVLVAANTPGDVPILVADAFARRGTPVQILVPGEVLQWHGIELRVDACGQGLAVRVRFGSSISWICDSGTRDEPGAVPTGGAAVIDVGDGTIEPLGGIGTGWVVEHGGRAGRGSLAPGTLGSRLWRTARDGPLALSCDELSCVR
ncbi:MAG: ComEC/Rec2 family competence protein [Candidatus Dormibacteria bacterium]